MKHVIVKARKISNVSGNIKYLQDEKKHPELCYTYNTCPEELWIEYANHNQQEFEHSGNATNKSSKCVEAHELIYVLPEEFYRLTDVARKKFAISVAESFKKRHGVECMAALHGSDKECCNMHIHLMYMERRQEFRDKKIADRRLYFDERGRQVKSKKYAVDEEGSLLPGYSFVRKGETYGTTKNWTSKDSYLKSNKFTHDEKEWWADILNKARNYEWAEDMEERSVYDRKTSPYLPMQNVPQPLKYSDENKQDRANKKQAEYVQHIIKCNELRKEYNKQVDVALEKGADLDELTEYRKQLSKEIYEKTKKDHSETRRILHRALGWINRVLERLNELKSLLGASEAFTGIVEKKASLLESIENAKSIIDSSPKTRQSKKRQHDREH